MTETKGFYTKKVDELQKNFKNITKDYKSVEDAFYVSNDLCMLSTDLLGFAREMAESIDHFDMEHNQVTFPYLKPDTPEHIGKVLQVIDERLTVDRITMVDSVLTSFEIKSSGCFLAKVEKDGTHWSLKTYFDSYCTERDKNSALFKLTIDSYRIKELSEILPVINEFIELQEADNEQD